MGLVHLCARPTPKSYGHVYHYCSTNPHKQNDKS